MTPTYEEIIERIRAEGERCAPRGRPTLEVLGLHVQFDYDEIVRPNRYDHALALEILRQAVAGIHDLAEFQQVSPNANHALFTDVACDYGPRIRGQWMPLVRQLREDPETRRAVMTFTRWRSEPDDQPCPVAIQYLRRGNVLRAFVFMRSWDVGLGLAYDVVLFGGLLRHMSVLVQAEPATVDVWASSAHIYETPTGKEQ